MIAQTATDSVTVPASLRHWPLIVGACVLGVLGAYWHSIASMIYVWETSDTYAHGWLIAPISLYLLWQKRDRLAATPQALCWWALLPLAVSGLAWTVATLADVQVVQQLAVVTIICGVVLFVMGWRWSLVAIFPLGFLYLSVPLGDGLVPHMIDYTADFVVAALRLSGIPVYRDGTNFVIPSGSWSVVSGCSGMRYLMATVTVGVLFAHLNYRSPWRKIAFVGVAIGVAFVANWIRAYGIVMIAHFSNMTLALGVDHYVYGWVFFGIIIFLLMLIGSTFSDRSQASDPVAGPPLPTVVSRGLLPGLLALLCVTFMWPVAVRVMAAHAPVIVQQATAIKDAFGEPDAAVPNLGWTPHYVGEPQIVNGGLVAADMQAGWQVGWYSQQKQGAELIHAGNQLVREKYEPWRQRSRDIRATGANAVPRVVETVLRARESERLILVWQWYWTGGQATVSALGSKLLGVASQLRGQGNPGASVLIYAVVDGDDGLDHARQYLEAELTRVAPRVHAVFEQTWKQ